MTTGTHQVEMSHDEGETAIEIAECLTVIVEALDRSSLDPADKLNWALDALLKDQFEVCGEFADYLNRRHPGSAWQALADRLLADLRWPGIASTLREQLREVRALEKNWPVVAAIQAEESPSRETFADCKKACGKIKAWPRVRRHLLDYLETGELPWKQEGWPLPGTCLDTPKAERGDRFPMMDKLIGIAILEKKPDQALQWYDQLLEKGSRRHGVNEDEIAESIQTHAPNRAVDIWKNIAQQLIAEVKPKAYQAAARYLRKAARVMARLKKQSEWERYLETLRKEHYRKRRLLEILDSLEGTPIIGKK
ncbi:hypothetical protein BMS3Abin14_00009 [bacterium BMS3Abin14]|nr:hypothetical protein BMS3Abin14_00009 [bacterium BMS3Abin14]